MSERGRKMSFGSAGRLPETVSAQPGQPASPKVVLLSAELVKSRQRTMSNSSIGKPSMCGASIRLNDDVVVDMGTRKGETLTLMPKRQRCAVSMRADDTDRWGHEDLDEREDYSLVLRDPTVKVELLNRLNTFRKNRELCDVVLFVREREIFAHKVVLAAVSPALFDMFLEEGRESSAGANGSGSQSSSPRGSVDGLPGKEFGTTVAVAPSTKQPMAYFEFAQTDYDCFAALVDFAYTAYLEISSKKVAELYKTAFALQMTPVVQACANYLAENLSVNNCIGIRRQANFNNDTYLVDKVDAYIGENLEQIIDESVEFTQLPCVKTRIIISMEEMRQAGGDWLGSNLAERVLHYFESLPRGDRADHGLETIVNKTHLLYIEEERRLADCAEMDERSSVGSCDMIQDYKRTGKKRVEIADALGAPAVQHRVTGATAVRLNASRVPNNKYSSTESLDSVDSSQSDPEDTIETRLIAVRKNGDDGFWIALAVLHRRLVALSIQLTDDEELVKNGNGKSGSVGSPPSQLDSALLSRLVGASAAQRAPLAHMAGARCSIGAVFVEGKIIVCGGYNRGECLRSVEEYDVQRGEWKQLKEMNDERGRFDSAVLGGKVYAIAGSNGNNDLRTCESYDPRADKWATIAPLIKARSHNGCASLDGVLYCIGGSSDQVVMKDCEKYSPDSNEWQKMAAMENARYQAGVLSWKGLVVACGGCDGWQCMDSVEAFDPKTNQWHRLAKLRTPRRGCAVAVIRDSLYVIGGHDGQNSLASVEVLDSPSGEWRTGPQLTTPRANTHAVVTAGNVIYVIGGFNGNTFLDSIELMENESVGWRSWQQCVVVDKVDEEEEEEEATPRIDMHGGKTVEAQ